MSHSPAHTETEKTVDGVANPAAEIVELLLRAGHVLRVVSRAYFAEFGLSDVRFAVLKKLQSASPTGCSQTELAQNLNQSESSISTLIERMRSDGLLYRLRSKADRRKRVLMLTPRGREMLAQAGIWHNQKMNRLLRCFDPEEKKLFSRLLGRLVEELADDRRGVRTQTQHDPPRPTHNEAAVAKTRNSSSQRWSA